MFNFIGMIMLAAIVWPLGDIFINAYVRAIPDPMWQLSVFHLIFNTGTACVLIFFVTPLNKFATWAIKGKAEDASVMKTKFIDDHLLPTPAIAMEQLPKEILHMASKAKVNLGLAFDALVNQSLVNKEEINREEDYIDFLTRQIGRFIIKLSAQQISEDDELFVGSFHHVINDLERVGDYAIKMLSAAGRMRKHSQQFSKKASSELKKMFDKLMELYDVCIEIFETRNADKIKDAKKIDSEIDLMKSRLADAHLLWLKGGQYTAIGGEHFYAAVCDLERIADHLINIAYTTRALEDSELSGNEIAEEEQGKQAMADDEIQLEFALPATEIVKADLMDETSFIRNRD
jgi:phosphate:Na+ symporter